MVSFQDVKEFLRMLFACFLCKSSCIMGNRDVPPKAPDKPNK